MVGMRSSAQGSSSSRGAPLGSSFSGGAALGSSCTSDIPGNNKDAEWFV